MLNQNQVIHGSNRTAVETTIAALNREGRLGDVDAARVALIRSLADAVDADPSNASLWREYRSAEEALREADDTTADEFSQLLAALSSEMGDTETK
jgi:hypothetical protein